MHDVWIELFKPEQEFIISGNLIEGKLYKNLVKLTDKLCLRYAWNLQSFIDVEVYGLGSNRQAWFRLDISQFNLIKNYIKELA